MPQLDQLSVLNKIYKINSPNETQKTLLTTSRAQSQFAEFHLHFLRYVVIMLHLYFLQFYFLKIPLLQRSFLLRTLVVSLLFQDI